MTPLLADGCGQFLQFLCIEKNAGLIGIRLYLIDITKEISLFPLGFISIGQQSRNPAPQNCFIAHLLVPSSLCCALRCRNSLASRL